MTAPLTRRRLLAALAATTAAAPAFANAPETSLRPLARGEDFFKRAVPTLDEIASAANLDGFLGCAVGNTETGELLEDLNGAEGLPPASVAKALTASYALEHLGPDHRFVTRLLTSGEVSEDGTLDGDLILAGGADPTLDTDGLAALAGDLRDAGVSSVTGRLLVWGGALPEVPAIDPGQPDHVGYNPSVAGLNLNYNRVHFEWQRAGEGYQVAMDGRSDSLRPPVHMARMVVVARRTPVYTYHDGDARDEWTVAKSALGNAGSRWLPVRRPTLYAGEVFQAVAGSNGLRLKSPEVVDTLPEDARELARRESQPLTDILQDMLKWSTNLTAEVVGCAATAAATGSVPASLEASAAELNGWAEAELGVTGIALVDHSGLGEDSRVAPVAMTRALIALRERLDLKPILKPIPMRDDARRILSNHPLDVHAKTGTLNFVSGLAGYIDCPDGTELAFAIFSGDLDHRATIAREDREGPPGARTYNTRAKKWQMELIKRWGTVYGTA
ncbi:D-alanyl-D-alanine carboxypeptidase/D-alanyl-D-alanine-endopeptidase [Roseivivax marinus]|uniref:D-alanyl-D-alanine carboxypeptidase/D-alanyl-D-alanine-endopeptidase n=1 Tax=Roseivivax marinus TaxID=1379903 RepID=W4HNF0_9RHOB|nr:D-alanyl-D-alanine carboxypeptidase/D-alanyl-D-alanine-endopeptidase [Roseivivax marinus]ETW13646.1 D-alanyl-D-alanine carboxypeptidase/D-alanyl-D-alanine-endopeptidase [Roseivivax marinus]